MSEIQLKKKSRASSTRRPHRTLLMLMYSCSIRIGDTLFLPPADIKSDEGLIYNRREKRSKHRRVPLSSWVLTELRKYYKAHKPRLYLFIGQKGGQYTYGDMNIKGISMAHYMPNGNAIGVKYAYINEL